MSNNAKRQDASTLPSETVCRALARLGRTVERALEGTPLTSAGYRLMANLALGREVPVSGLARKLFVSSPTVTTTVDAFEKRGLVTRSAEPSDGRKVKIAATAAGQQALTRADEAIGQRLVELFALMEPDEAEVVVRSLEIFDRVLDIDWNLRHGADRPSNRKRASSSIDRAPVPD